MESTLNINIKDYVIFNDTGSSNKVIGYVYINLNTLKENFKLKNKRFVLQSDIEKDIENFEAIKYYYPYLQNLNCNNKSLDLFRSVGNTNGEQLHHNEILLFESNSLENFKKQIDSFLFNIDINEADYLPVSVNDYKDDSIRLDIEVERKLETILNQFENLKDTGQLLQILPVLENYLKESNRSYRKISKLSIDNEFKIFLVDYNIEVKLSHLTKCVYLLFLNYPTGIKLNELKNYSEELLNYYKAISNRDDYDKMTESITGLVNVKSNAIYVHLSRIKSAFIKVIHPSIAINYYIDGGKLKSKKIKLNRTLVNTEHLNNVDEIDF